MKLRAIIVGFGLGIGLLAGTALPAVAAVPSGPGGGPPAPPLPRSPVAAFRVLLAQGAEERAATLARRSEAQRAVLVGRLAEYDALPIAVREERLLATDLYWHMQQLLPRAPSERGELIAAASPELRGVLSERLALWDRLPAADRTALLLHERAIRYFARLREVVPPPLPGIPTASRVPSSVHSEFGRLGELSESERTRLVGTWRQFFEPESGPGERQRERTLRAMSEEERLEMDGVLRRFRSLPPAQRQVCIESFARFATLSPAERVGFLRNAERWEALSAEERRTWRGLVTKLPPLPPVSAVFQFPPLPDPSPRARTPGGGATARGG